VRESKAVDEADGPIEYADETPEAAERNARDGISLRRFLLLGD
jgi:hypothetical protein